MCVDVLKSSPQRRRKKKREIFVFFVFFCFRFLRDWKRRRNAPTDSRHEEMNWPTSSPSLLVVLPASRKRTINNCTWTFVILLAVFTHLAGKSLLSGGGVSSRCGWWWWSPLGDISVGSSSFRPKKFLLAVDTCLSTCRSRPC